MDADSVKTYTRAEAKILGKRALCDDSDTGHRIERRSSSRYWNGKLVCEDYMCENCDVIVTLTYPEKP